MKSLFICIVLTILSLNLFAQTPQSFQYQAVVRDASGTALVSQPVTFQISIISGSMTGTVEYVETHSSSTNAYGIVTLSIGTGTPVTGIFSNISWGTNTYFVKVEADPTGGTSYLDMGTTQLLSVPYALYAETAGNAGQTYTAGTGISIAGNVITNDSPDQVVNINSGTGVQVSGTYPNFTIDNTSPDQTLNLTGTGSTTVSGTYPNYTINSTDNNTTYTAGTGIDVTGTTITNTSPDQPVTLTQGGATTITGIYPNFTISSTDLNTGTPGGLNKTIQFNNSGSFGGDTALIWDNTNKRMGVGLTNPNGRMVVRGSATASLTEPLFEVKNADGQTVFVVYPDSVHVYVKDGGAKANQGGFAVSGRNAAKAVTNNYLTVTPDSTRIFTGDTISGFGVENLGTGTSTSYMHLTPSNYFIGHQAGDSITTGLYNSFFGYQCGLNNSTGNFNVFTGYKSGYTNEVGTFNTFMGFKSGMMNTGSDNTFIGYEAGSSHQGGGGNVYIGSKAGQLDVNGVDNIFIGENCGVNNVNGTSNIFIGYRSGFFNSDGNQNIFLGSESGYGNTTGSYNTFLGYQSGKYNTIGTNNMAAGFNALVSNTSGSENVAIGTMALALNTTGTYNVANGYKALFSNTTGFNNVAIGNQTLYTNTTGDENTAIGYQTLYFTVSGGRNVASGYQTLYKNTIGSGNVANGYMSLYSNTTGNNNVALGYGTLFANTTGFNNTALGNNCFTSGTAYSNSTTLGANSSMNASNKIRFGNTAVTVIEGQVAYSFPSDGRFKNNVTEEVKGLDFITKLRPVVYNFDTRKYEEFLLKDVPDSIRKSVMNSNDYSLSTSIRQSGFIAQEVVEAAKESGYLFNGVHVPENDNDNYSVAYSLFTVPLVKAVQEQQKQIEELKTEIEELKLLLIKSEK